MRPASHTPPGAHLRGRHRAVRPRCRPSPAGTPCRRVRRRGAGRGLLLLVGPDQLPDAAAQAKIFQRVEAEMPDPPETGCSPRAMALRLTHLLSTTAASRGPSRFSADGRVRRPGRLRAWATPRPRAGAPGRRRRAGASATRAPWPSRPPRRGRRTPPPSSWPSSRCGSSLRPGTRTGRSATTTSWSAKLSSRISMREASAFHTARVAEGGGVEVRGEFAVDPRQQVQVERGRHALGVVVRRGQHLGRLGEVDAHQEQGALAQERAGVAQERLRLPRGEVADRGAREEAHARLAVQGGGQAVEPGEVAPPPASRPARGSARRWRARRAPGRRR